MHSCDIGGSDFQDSRPVHRNVRFARSDRIVAVCLLARLPSGPGPGQRLGVAELAAPRLTLAEEAL